jgi:hypothetical protein
MKTDSELREEATRLASLDEKSLREEAIFLVLKAQEETKRHHEENMAVIDHYRQALTEVPPEVPFSDAIN